MEGINFHGPEWATIKGWLLKAKETKTDLLVGAEDHDKSNKLRGALSMINEILQLEKAALNRGR